MALLSRIKTWIAGETLTASDLNAEFNNLINNLDPDGVEDASANNGEMQATRDPYAGDAIVLSASLRHELQALRYLIKQQNVSTQWYIFPDLVTKTSTYTATLVNRVILGDASGGGFTITLPTAVGAVDKLYYIKNIGASGTVTIDGDGSETIDGNANKALGAQFEFVILISDNSNWHILGGSSANVVTLTDTQTLTNKTLTTPTIGDFTNATHDHADAAGGGNTLLIPTIADLTNMTHNHSDASEGGADLTIGTATGTDLTLSGAAASPPDSNTITKENIVKAWAHVTYSGGTPTLADNFNVSGIVDGGVGLITLQWNTDFANATYVVAGSGDGTGGLSVSIVGGAGLTTADADMEMRRGDTNALEDPTLVTFIAIGDQ